MTFFITNGCCKDGSCIPVCPVQCIRPVPGDPDFTTSEQLYIDPATCIDCGACMDECPVDAVGSPWDVTEDQEHHLQVNAAAFEMHPIVESPPPVPVRRVLPVERPALAVAIVGSGPAACYAAAELSAVQGVSVSVFERLPTPFGLVRFGVAPDHSNTKKITARFASVFSRPNVHCFFNVEVGPDLSVDELLEYHHAVIWAGGASDDRRLGIPGEDLPGCHSAREFVAWYNGHPEHASTDLDLSGGRAVVIGNGNVALDVARLLAQPTSRLQSTDIADHALSALGASNITEVVVVGRRGPEHAAYSVGEVIALGRTDGITLLAPDKELNKVLVGSGAPPAMAAEAISPAPVPGTRSVVLRFGLQPISINGAEAVESVTFQRSDGTLEVVDAHLVLRAAGYRGTAVEGLPFDSVTTTLPNTAGRVYDPVTGDPLLGMYCAGWIKRGATGVIGTNKTDAAESVEALLHDFAAGRLQSPGQDVDSLTSFVRSRFPGYVDKQAWARIDQEERRRGREVGRPRRKLVSTADLLTAAEVQAS